MNEEVVLTVVFTPGEGQFDDLHRAMVEGIPAVHEEQGCLLYSIHRTGADQIVMIEKWSTQADLDAHANGAPVARLNELIGDFLAGPPVITTMTALPAGTPEQGLL